MEKFAGYGFNKSHAAAYALLAYQTAYMKSHHAAAFMAANLSAVMDDTDKVRQLYEDALANGLRVLPPDVNASEYRFVPVDRQTIRYGLGAARWDLRQTLLEEKTALGFYLSGHLFAVYERDLAGFPRTPLSALTASEQRVWIAGIVASARVQMTRRGRMMVVMLDDGSAQLEISVFNELFEKHRDKLKEDTLLVVAGKVQRDEFSGGLRVSADELLDLEGLRGRYAARLRIAMNGQADAKRLQQVLAPYRASGACQVLVRYENGAAACEIALGDAWRVRPDGRLLAELDAWLTPGNVQLVYNGVS